MSKHISEENNKVRLYDKLMPSCMQYYLVIIIYLLAGYCVICINMPYIMIFIVYAILPVLDEFIPYDQRNPSNEEAEMMSKQLKFKIPLYLSLFVDWVITYFCLQHVLNHPELSGFTVLGNLLICGTMSALNINVAHELFHKEEFCDRFFGTLTLAKNLYMHFRVEHVYGHHRNVATPLDPATSKKNQSIVSFLPQTLFGALKSSWNFEANRLKERGQLSKSSFSPENRMIQYFVFQSIFVVLVQRHLGWVGLMYFLFNAAMSVFYLESINYIEHYGLQRKEVSPGVYEKVDIRHSWNAPQTITNYLLFKLQRHSDHHENGYKPYQILCSYKESPVLPQGYIASMMMSWFPSFWFSLMNPILEYYQKGDKATEEERQQVINHKNKKVRNFIIMSWIVTLTMLALSYKY